MKMNNVRSWLSALALTVVICPAAAQSPGSIESYMNYGGDYLQAGNASSAVTYYRLAVAMDPNHAEANYMLAVALQRSGKSADAKPYLERALALNPVLKGRQESAVFAAAPAQPANPAPAAKPRPTPVPAVAAAPAKAMAATGAVGSEYDKATRGDGGAAFQIRSGREELAMGGYEFAESYFRVGLRLEPDNAAAHFLLGAALQAQGRQAEAKAALARAVAIDPSLASRSNEWPAAPRPVATKPAPARAPAKNPTKNKASNKPMTCDEIFGSCTAGATGAAKNMCFVRRNQCKAALED